MEDGEGMRQYFPGLWGIEEVLEGKMRPLVRKECKKYPNRPAVAVHCALRVQIRWGKGINDR